MELAGQTVLWHTLKRCFEVPGVDLVCCATTTEAEDDQIVLKAREYGAVVYRGSADDVLQRYLNAALEVGANRILRVTSDCPLIDPGVCGEVLTLESDVCIDFATNNLKAGWPHGLDCEVFSVDLLAKAARYATRSEEREHVTPWMRRHPDLRLAHLPGPGGVVQGYRWTLDYEEDLEFFRQLLDLAPPPPHRDWRYYAEILDQRPDIVAVNSHRHQPRQHDSGYRHSV